MELTAIAVGLLPEVERLCPELAPMSGIDPTRGNSGAFFADADPAAYGPQSPSTGGRLIAYCGNLQN